MFRKGNRLWLSAVLVTLSLAAISSCKSGGGTSAVPTAPGSARELDSGSIAPGAVYQHRFATAGTFAYHCIFHAPMTGSVLVDAGATDTLAAVSISSATMSFPGASVKPGGRVVWTNNTGVPHTVTSN